MTEGPNHVSQLSTDQELESTAIAGAEAVQRLIAERNNLRDQLASSLATQEELRRRIGTLHQRYIELARKLVALLHHFDNTMRDAVGEKAEGVSDALGHESKPHFDSNGLPAGPLGSSTPNANGGAYVRGPIEP
jgi:hypothetical protein